jgi:hypothetical protein
MPSLSRVDLNGVADLSLSGFESDDLSIKMEGVVRVSGKESRIQNLSFKGNGLLKMEMYDAPVNSADINYDGLYMMEVLMDGGELSGKIDGIGGLNWKGDVRENSIKVEGPGKILHVK